MNIFRFGANPKLITVVCPAPPLPVFPFLVSNTRWLLLNPACLPDLDSWLSSTTRRAENVSGSTWAALSTPTLAPPSFTSRIDNTFIYTFGPPRHTITLIHTIGEPIIPERVGSASIILSGRLSFDWLQHIIRVSPRRTQNAIPYLKSLNLPPSSVFMRESFHRVPSLRSS